MKRLFSLVLIVLLALVALPVAAQVDDVDLTETYDWPIGISVDFPESWESSLDDEGYMHLNNGTTDMVFGFFEIEDDDDDIESFVRVTFEETHADETLSWDEDLVVSGTLPNFDEVVAYLYEDTFNSTVFERLVVGVQVTDTLVVVANAIPLTDGGQSLGTEITDTTEILAIMNSLREGPGADQTAPDPIVTEEAVEDDTIPADFTNRYSWDVARDDLELTVTVAYPDTWALEITDNDVEHLTSAESDMVFSFYLNPTQTLEEIAERNFTNTRVDDTLLFEDGELVTGTLPSFDEVVAYTYLENLDGDRYDRSIIVVQPDERIIIAAAAIPLRGREIIEYEEILAIVDTLRVSDGESTPAAQDDAGGKGGR